MATKQKNPKLHLFMIILVLLGAITWGAIGAFNYNIIHSLLMGNTMAKKIVYTLIGISGLYIAMCKNTYWPYLGESTFPAHLLAHCEEASQGKKMQITTSYPNTAIVYWVKNEKDGSLYNSGTAQTNNMAIATIILAEPDKKKVPGYWMIPKEIYYRAVTGPGSLSQVEKTSM